MNNLQLTEDDKTFIRAMHAAVKERGRDFVYTPRWNGCAYVHNRDSADEEAGCLVGLAYFTAKGFHISSECEGESAEQVLFGELSPPVLLAATKAQGVQDQQFPWGEAIDKFDEILRSNGITVEDILAEQVTAPVGRKAPTWP